MSIEKADPLIGLNLGDFIIERKLGEGGFGAVYQANQITLSRPAVIKVLHTKHRESQNIIERFKREAYLASRLEHPYMAHIYSFGVESDGLLWIAMEYVAGTPLDKWLKANGAMPLTRFISLFDKICEVIQTAHEAGIVHRDIKPANIMVISRAGRLLPKLLDFGIAKDLSIQSAFLPKKDFSHNNQIFNELSEVNTEVPTLLTQKTTPKPTVAGNSETQVAATLKSETIEIEKVDTASNKGKTAVEESQNTQELTLIRKTVIGEEKTYYNSFDNKSPVSEDPIQTEGIIGSPRYMSPEQWENGFNADARSDIYALGVTTYELLTGKPPFKEVGYALMSAHLHKAVPSLGNAFPEKLNTVIAKAMAKAPKERYQTALEFAQDLRDAAGLSEQQINLPQLDSLLTSEILNDAPQPIAESVSNLNAAKNAFQLRDNILAVFRVLVRYLGLLALASHSSIKLSNKESENILNSVKKLRSSGLSESEWISFTQELCEPFAKEKDVHPIPELVAVLFPSDIQQQKKLNDGFNFLLHLEETRNVPTKEEQLIKELEQAINHLSNILRIVGFLGQYLLIVPNDEQGFNPKGEKWVGIIKHNRSVVHLKGKDFVAEHPVLTDFEGNVILALWPLIQVASPSLGQDKELFFLERKGRHGAKLVSFPSGFEHEDENPWQWLKNLFFADEENPQGSLSEEKSPYPGLSTFKSEDVNLFYGREKETESFLNRLKVQPFLAIVGPSGAGKSSFVQAGIIPSLEKPWRIITARPGVSPLANLAARLAKEDIDISKLTLEKKHDFDELGNILRKNAQATNSSILLIIDQFEELFTLCLNQQERELYAAYLAKAARSEEEPIRVIITLRDDFLIRVKSLPGLQDKITQNLELLITPQPEDLLRILTEPAKRFGYQFEDTELPKEIVESVKRESSALPLLAFTAAKLWELRDRQFKQLRRKTYEAMGGIGGSLTQHAETVMTEMSQDEQKLVREAFRHLVTSEGTRSVLTRLELRQLLGNNREADLVIEKLVSARLLVASEGEGGSEIIEVIHEALLSTWPRLVKWRQEAAEGARLRDQLRVAARQWQERNRPKGLLWRDEALTEYQLWRTRYQGNLTEVEEAFGQSSITEANRSKQVRRWLLVAAIVILLTGSAVLFYQQKETKQQLMKTLELYEEQGRQEMLKGNLSGAAVYLSEAYSKGANGLALKYMLAVALAKAEAHPPITLTGHADLVTMATFSPDDTLIATASKDHTAKLWQTIGGKELFTLKGHEDSVISAHFSPDGKLLVTASLDKTARIWNVSDGKQLVVLNGHTDGVENAIFSPDGKQVLTISYDHTAKVWDSLTGKLINSLEGHQGAIYNGCYSRDGKIIVTASADKTTKIWDSATGKLLNTLTGHQAGVVNVVFSPDDKLLVTASADKTAKLWQVADGKLLNTFTGHERGLTDCSFSPEGKTILTTSSDNKAYLWNIETGQKIVLEGHFSDISNGGFSPDGKLVITSSYDKTLRIWESDTGKFLVAFAEHGAALSSGLFSNKGEKVVTTSADKTAKIWQIAVESRLPSEVAAIVHEKIPFSLQEGRLVSTTQPIKQVAKEEDVIKIEEKSSERLYIEDLGNGIKLEMVKIEGGTFEMGTPKTDKDHNNDEDLHTVKVSSFYIGKYEVTQALWKAVAALPAINMRLTSNATEFKGDNLPVERVSWEEVKEFCARLSKATGKIYRLPTEAEWEYAARAGSKSGSYPEPLKDYAWFDENSGGKTHPIGQKKPNPWGLYDIYGNVYEWCEDWYGDYPTTGIVVDPKGPSSGTLRVDRGGGYASPAEDCRSAIRFYYAPEDRGSRMGFRLAMQVK